VRLWAITPEGVFELRGSIHPHVPTALRLVVSRELVDVRPYDLVLCVIPLFVNVWGHAAVAEMQFSPLFTLTQQHPTGDASVQKNQVRSQIFPLYRVIGANNLRLVNHGHVMAPRSDQYLRGFLL
jgi:hypothetical protein